MKEAKRFDISKQSKIALNKTKLTNMIRHIFIALLLLGSQLKAANELKISTTVMQQKAYSGGYFLVKITVEPKNLNSFFQIEQLMPAGMIAEGVDSHDGIFSFKEGKAKFTWLRIPQEKSFDVMYKVMVPFDAKGNYQIDGNYYFIEDEEKVIIPIAPKSIEIIEHSVNLNDTIVEKKLLGIIERTSLEQNELSKAERDDIIFKIQILSSTRKLDRDSLKKAFQLKEKVYEDISNGLYKYTIGKFKNYETARNFKETLDMNKFIPFVVAYKNDIRISIGEAMQILGQRRNQSAKMSSK